MNNRGLDEMIERLQREVSLLDTWRYDDMVAASVADIHAAMDRLAQAVARLELVREREGQ